MICVELFFLSPHHSCQENILVKCPFLYNLMETQLVIKGLVANMYLKKRKQIYSLSLLWALLYKKVVQEKEVVEHENQCDAHTSLSSNKIKREKY